jgi:hypothetical protein
MAKSYSGSNGQLEQPAAVFLPPEVIQTDQMRGRVTSDLDWRVTVE